MNFELFELYRDYRILLDNSLEEQKVTLNELKRFFQKANFGRRFYFQALVVNHLMFLNEDRNFNDFSLLHSCFEESIKFCYEKEAQIKSLEGLENLNSTRIGSMFAEFLFSGYLPLLFYLATLGVISEIPTNGFITDNYMRPLNTRVLFGNTTKNDKSLKFDEFINMMFMHFSKNLDSNIIKINSSDNYRNIIQTCDKNYNYQKTIKSDEKPPVGTFIKDKKYIVNPAVGRDQEKRSMEISLLMPETSSILVGPAGVGKTAIVDGLNYDIQNGKITNRLKDKKILMTSSTELVSGCSLVGQLENRFLKLCQYVKKNPEVILYIDEIHTLIGGGRGSDSTNELSNMIKPYLSSGELKLIGATTEEEYEKYFLGESAFRRRFEPTIINEPDKETLKWILLNCTEKLTKQTAITFEIPEEMEICLEKIIKYSNAEFRNQKDYRYNPSLAVNILNRIFATAEYNNHQFIGIDDIATGINDCSYTLAQVDSKKL